MIRERLSNYCSSTIANVNGITNQDLYNLGNQICQDYWNIKLDCPVLWSNRPKGDNACGQFWSTHLNGNHYAYGILLCPYIYNEYGYKFLIGNLKHELCHWICFKNNLDCGKFGHSNMFLVALKSVNGLRHGIPDANQSCWILRCPKCNKMSYSNQNVNIHCVHCHHLLSKADVITTLPLKKIIKLNYGQSISDFAEHFYRRWLY